MGEGGQEGLRGVGCCEVKRNECGVVVVFEVRGVERWIYIGRCLGLMECMVGG